MTNEPAPVKGQEAEATVSLSCASKGPRRHVRRGMTSAVCVRWMMLLGRVKETIQRDGGGAEAPRKRLYLWSGRDIRT